MRGAGFGTTLWAVDSVRLLACASYTGVCFVRFRSPCCLGNRAHVSLRPAPGVLRELAVARRPGKDSWYPCCALRLTP